MSDEMCFSESVSVAFPCYNYCELLAKHLEVRVSAFCKLESADEPCLNLSMLYQPGTAENSTSSLSLMANFSGIDKNQFDALHSSLEAITPIQKLNVFFND